MTIIESAPAPRNSVAFSLTAMCRDLQEAARLFNAAASEADNAVQAMGRVGSWGKRSNRYIEDAADCRRSAIGRLRVAISHAEDLPVDIDPDDRDGLHELAPWLEAHARVVEAIGGASEMRLVANACESIKHLACVRLIEMARCAA